MFNCADNELINKLVELVGTNRVITGEDIGVDFCQDEYPGETYKPDAVVEARSTEEVSEVMKLCSNAGVPVTVRGAGTGQAGGSVAIHGGIVLSVKQMNKILEYNEESKTLRVQPGVLLQDVKAEAERHGMYYPPDPGEQTATIGGNASTNAAGPSTVKYGETRDYVLDAEIVLADGSIETLSSKEEFADIVGSEGILAVITELTLKLIDKPGADAILLFPFMDTQSAVDAATKLLNPEYDPAVVEYMDTDIIEFSAKVTENTVFPVEMDGERVGATLMVTIEGDDDDAVMEKMETIAGLAEEGEIECLDILVADSPSMKRDFWAAHAALHTSMESGAASAFEINVNIPANAVVEMIEYAKNLAQEKGMRALIHSHIGSGGIHIHVASEKNREETAPLADAFRDAVYGKCAELGGDIVGEYGVGYAKVKYLNSEIKDKYSAVKTILDPKGILNPGKIVG